MIETERLEVNSVFATFEEHRDQVLREYVTERNRRRCVLKRRRSYSDDVDPASWSVSDRTNVQLGDAVLVGQDGAVSEEQTSFTDCDQSIQGTAAVRDSSVADRRDSDTRLDSANAADESQSSEQLSVSLESTDEFLEEGATVILCIPQELSLRSRPNLDDVRSHMLVAAAESRGDFVTLDGRKIIIKGNQVFVGGAEKTTRVRPMWRERMVFVLYSESVPVTTLCGAGGTEIGKYLGVLRSYPEHEPVFEELDEVIGAVQDAWVDDAGSEFHENVQRMVKSWIRTSAASLIYSSSCFAALHHRGATNENGDTNAEGLLNHLRRERESLHTQVRRHTIQVEQALEGYVMAQLHDQAMGQLRRAFVQEDTKFAQEAVALRARGLNQQDLGMRPEYQCPQDAAIEHLQQLSSKITPLEKLLCLETVVSYINAAVEDNLHRHFEDVSSFQLTTDDLLDQLIYVMVWTGGLEDLSAQIYFMRAFHTMNVNTTALGYNLANVEVAALWIMGNGRELSATTVERMRERVAPCGPPLSQTVVATDGDFSRLFVVVDAQNSSREVMLALQGSAGERRRPAVSWQEPALLENIQRFAASKFTPGVHAWIGRSGRIRVSTGMHHSLLSRQRFRRVACGENHMLAVNHAGQLFAWGDNRDGQVGVGEREDRCTSPMWVDFPASTKADRAREDGRQIVVEIACGARHSLALTADQEVWSWGRGTCGRLGLGPRTDTQYLPARVDRLNDERIEQLAVGWSHSLAISELGAVFVWGCGAEGRLGLGTDACGDSFADSSLTLRSADGGLSCLVPLPLPHLGSHRIVSVDCGRYHAAAVTDLSEVLVWGFDEQDDIIIPEPALVRNLLPGAADHVICGAGTTFVVFSAELKYAEGELVAVLADDKAKKSSDKFLMGRLAADVVRSPGDESGQDVEILWYDVDAEDGVPATTYRARSENEETPVGAIVCALTSAGIEVEDDTVRVSDEAFAFAEKQLEKQLKDDYVSDDDSQFGDAAVAARKQAADKKKSRNAKRSRHGKAKRGASAAADDDGDVKTEDAEDVLEDDGNASENNNDDNDDDDGAPRARKSRKTSKTQKRKSAPRKIKKDADDEALDVGAPPKKGKRGGHKLAPRPNVPVVPDYWTQKIKGQPSSFRGDVERASKELIRAVRTSDQKAFKALLADRKGLCSSLVFQSVHFPINSLMWAVIQDNKDMVERIVNDAASSETSFRVSMQACAISQLSTGEHTSQFSNGYGRRRINASRGSKEGNNALLKDLRNGTYSMPCERRKIASGNPLKIDNRALVSATHAENLAWNLMLDFDPLSDAMIDVLEGKYQALVHYDTVDEALQSGNIRLARRLIELDKAEGGLNFLHIEALQEKKPPKNAANPFSAAIRAASVTKKSHSVSRATPVAYACINPCADYLKALLKASPKAASSVDTSKRTLLHYAAACEGPDPLRHLLSTHIELDRLQADRTSFKLTPLGVACKFGRATNVKALLESAKGNESLLRSMLDVCAVHGSKPLHVVAHSRRSGRYEVADILLAFGADVEPEQTAEVNKKTPLHIAVACGDLQMAEKLVKAGAKPNKADKLQRSPLIYACMNGQIHIVAWLLRLGVDAEAADSSGNTPLHYAAAYGFEDCVELLLTHGQVPPDPKNDWKTSPLGIALQKGRNAVAEVLFRQAVDVNFPDDKGRSPLFQLLEDYVERLANRKIELAPSGPSRAALLEAMPWALRTLFERKDVELGRPNAQGETALHVLAKQRFPAEIKAGVLGRLVDLFLEKAAGVDVNACDKDGLSAVVLAAASGNTTIFSRLVNAGASLETARDSQGRNVLHLVFCGGADSPASAAQLELILKSLSEKAVHDLAAAADDEGYTPVLRAASSLCALSGIPLVAGCSAFRTLCKQLPGDALKAYVQAERDRRDPVRVAHLLQNGDGPWKTMLELDAAAAPDVATQDSLAKAKEREVLKSCAFAPSSRANENKNVLHFVLSMRDNSTIKDVLTWLLPLLKDNEGSSLAHEPAGPPGQRLSPLQAFLRERYAVGHATSLQHDATIASTSRDTSIFNGMDAMSDVSSEASDVANRLEENAPAAAPNEAMSLSKSDLELFHSICEMLVTFDEKADLNALPESVFADDAARHAFSYPASQEQSDIDDIRRALKANKIEGLPRALETLVQLRLKRRLALSKHNGCADTTPTTHLLVERPQLTVGQLGNLVALGLDISVENVSSGTNSLHVVLGRLAQPGADGTQGVIDIVEFICEKSPSLLQGVDSRRRTPLHVAAELENAAVLKTLLAAAESCGAKNVLDAQDLQGRTPLHLSVAKAAAREEEVLEPSEIALLDAGARLDMADERGQTPLHVAFLGSNTKVRDLQNFPHSLPENATHDRIELVNALLAYTTSDLAIVDTSDCWGRTPLMYAAAANALVSSLLLMTKGAKLFAKDVDGNNALGIAVLRGHDMFAITMLKSADAVVPAELPDVMEVKRKVRKHGADAESDVDMELVGTPSDPFEGMEIVSRKQESVFWHAVNRKQMGLAYIVLTMIPRARAIADAMECGSFQVVRKILSTCNRNELMACDPQGRCVLHHVADSRALAQASEWGPVLAEKMISRGVKVADVDENGCTPLHLAAARGNLSLSEFLLQVSPELALARDKNGEPPLWYLVRELDALGISKREAVALTELLGDPLRPLLMSGELLSSIKRSSKPIQLPDLTVHIGNLHLEGGPNSETVEREAAEEARKARGEEASNVSNEESKLFGNTTAAICTLHSDQMGVLDALVSRGVDLVATNTEGYNALHVAVLVANSTACLALLRRGATVDALTKAVPGVNEAERTPLMLATLMLNEKPKEALRIVETLLTFGADPTVTCSADGNTALHYAVMRNHLEAAETLIRACRDYARLRMDKSLLREITLEDFATADGSQFLVRCGEEASLFPIFRLPNREVVFGIGAAATGTPILKLKEAERVNKFLEPLTAWRFRELRSYVYDNRHVSVEMLARRDPRELQSEFNVPSYLFDKVNKLIEAAKKDFAEFQAAQAARSSRAQIPESSRWSQIIPADDLKLDDSVVFTELFRLAEEKKSEGEGNGLEQFGVGEDHVQKLSAAEAIAEKLNKFGGSEHLVVGQTDAQLTTQLEPGTGVLVYTEQENFLEGRILQRHPNQTYKVGVVRGGVVDMVSRSDMRPWGKPDVVGEPQEIRPGALDSLLQQRNNDDASCLDLVARPFDFGSYENTKMARMLVDAGAKVDDKVLGLVRPNGHLARFLRRIQNGGSTDDKDEMEIDEVRTSGVDDDDVLVELTNVPDAETYKREMRDAAVAAENEFASAAPPSAKVNPNCELKSEGLHVLPCGEDDFYDTVLIKVEMRREGFFENSFYKLQLVKDPIKNLVVMINNWGRIEEQGKFQQTPYGSEAEAIKEFEKVFKSKTGNAWAQRANFEPKTKKYRLVQRVRRQFEKRPLPSLATVLEDKIDFPDAKRQTLLSPAVLDMLKTVTDPRALEAAAIGAGLDESERPLGQISIEALLAAEIKLEEIATACDRSIKLRQESKLDEMRKETDKALGLSIEFYELIPIKDGLDGPVRPFTSRSDRHFRRAAQLVASLKDLAAATQMVIVGYHRRNEEHCLDRVYRFTGANMKPLPIGDHERTSVEQYFRNTRGNLAQVIVNQVFKVRRHGEQSNRHMHNRRLLWHGTPAANVLGVLKDGLRVAPVDSRMSGQAFGRGVYFSDMAEKSFAYCRSTAGAKAYLFLAEVALGQTKNIDMNSDNDDTAEKKPADSTTVQGGRQPDPTLDIVLNPAGVTVPLGPVVPRRESDAAQGFWHAQQKNYGPGRRRLSSAASKAIEAVRLNPETTFPAEVMIKAENGEPEMKVLLDAGALSRTATVVGDNSIYLVRLEEPEQHHSHAGFNEFVVPDTDRINIRYVVELMPRKLICFGTDELAVLYINMRT
ncbi:Ankyrin repeat and protein kinase domain-containing protein 1 [Hondaea fermentalgiana]|uniref:Poly [ADP-ribose] polymerase n=1 Tax=Hondaea fermentalgiana TaxID=2315210 RepID=A0A2R5GQZ8_9STRA|nr:Ankyrin repeat and protein kinase domain-containing protein 1 [Hondaea fermentalgiana]|eukprot:GBG33280.1 Ankyrin repeat and protein kinase domain-containing protein 1 [Hondaea fermentalgiana]